MSILPGPELVYDENKAIIAAQFGDLFVDVSKSLFEFSTESALGEFGTNQLLTEFICAVLAPEVFRRAPCVLCQKRTSLRLFRPPRPPADTSSLPNRRK